MACQLPAQFTANGAASASDQNHFSLDITHDFIQIYIYLFPSQ